jgi:hypothetical protein
MVAPRSSSLAASDGYTERYRQKLARHATGDCIYHICLKSLEVIVIGTCPRCNLRGSHLRHLPGGRLKTWTGAGGDLLNLDVRRILTDRR